MKSSAYCFLFLLASGSIGRGDARTDIEAVKAEGKKAETAGNWAEARAHYEKALQMSIGAYGEEHMGTAVLLNMLGLVVEHQGKHREAEALYRRSLAAREKVLPPDHIDMAVPLVNLGNVYRAGKEYLEAEMHVQRALAIRENALGKEHPDLVGCLRQLGDIYFDQKKSAEAEPLYQRVLAIREKTLGTRHAGVDQALGTLSRLAGQYSELGKFHDAERLHRTVLEKQEKARGPDDPLVAVAASDLGCVLGSLGRLDEALALHKRSLAIREKKFGAESDAVANCLNHMGLIYVAQGRYSLAEPAYARSLAIHQKLTGGRHPSVGAVLNNQGNMFYEQGMAAEAERCFELAVAAYENSLGKDHASVATALLNLANAYNMHGKEDLAEQALKRAARIYKASKNQIGLAGCLGNLASLYSRRNDLSTSEALRMESLSILERAYGPDHPKTGLALSNLARLRQSQGRLEEAETLVKRSISIYEKHYGPEHHETAKPIVNLGTLLEAQKKFEQAQGNYRRALDNYRRYFGDDHPDIARLLHHLAMNAYRRGNLEEAADWETQLRRGTRRYFLRELPNLSASDQQAMLGSSHQDRLAAGLSMAFQHREPALIASAAACLLNGKAISLEAQTIRTRLDQEITGPSGLKALADIKAIRGQEAALAFKSRTSQDSAAIAAERRQLEKQRQAIEKQLAPRGAAAAKLANPWVEIAEVQKAIAADGVLVDIARFRVNEFDPGALQGVVGPARYVAWVIPPAGGRPIGLVDLGPATLIDQAIQAARAAIESFPDRFDKGETAQSLEVEAGARLAAVSKLVWEPLRPHLQGARQIIVSPDGDLWLLPWAALPIAPERCLVEEYTLRLVVSGRDLIELRPGRPVAAANALIVADPDYNLSPTEVAAAMMNNAAGPVHTLAEETRGLQDELRGIGRVKRLPGTAAEGKRAFEKLKQLTGVEPRFCSDAEASEGIVKASCSPRVLVLATHGFFLKPTGEAAVNKNKKIANEEGKSAPARRTVDNPLLRCGLLLAGANRRAEARPDEDDGVLTGLEIVGLDLRGTELVVLSACETGLGDISAGEGVAGLRQAFQLAGAESVLSTLWQISDSATGQLMNTFYDELAGGDRAEALARAQRQFLKQRRAEKGSTHPFFWASFALTGK